VVIEDFSFDQPKTKAFQAILQALKVADKKPLTVLGDYDKTLYLSCRNIEKADIAPAQDLNTYRIMRAGALVVSESAIAKIKEVCE
jgi:large subunit ribosomal protein L4